MVVGAKESGEGGERRSSTAGLKTYVTVGSQQFKWERKLGQQNMHAVTFKVSISESPFDFLTGVVICVIVGVAAPVISHWLKLFMQAARLVFQIF